MSNPNENQSADPTPASIINNEADIIAWLRARAVQIGIPGLILKIDSETSMPVIAKVANDNHAFGCGATIEAAIKMLLPSVRTPEQQAEQKRAQAAKLLAEADELVPALPAVVEASAKEAA